MSALEEIKDVTSDEIKEVPDSEEYYEEDFECDDFSDQGDLSIHQENKLKIYKIPAFSYGKISNKPTTAWRAFGSKDNQILRKVER